MRRLMLAALAAVLLALPATPAAAADPVRPFGGVLIGHDSMSSQPGCPMYYSSVGQGQMLHLGRVSFTVAHCPVLTSPTHGTFADSIGVWTAANGDKVYIESEGSFDLDAQPPTVSHGTMTWHITSGTGRFANASGSGTATVFGDFATMTTTAKFSGTISY